MTEIAFDRRVPAFLIMIGSHVWDYGALATIRTLGRVGVPVYASVGAVDEAYEKSRFLTGRLPWNTTGAESEPELVSGILRCCDQIGSPAVAIAGDDEAAVLLARNRERLAGALLLPDVDRELPGRLANKVELASLCQGTGTAIPRSVMPETWPDVEQFAERCNFPVIVKNPEPFARLVRPAVKSTTCALNRGELFDSLSAWSPGIPVLIQEFIPNGNGTDWYVEAVFGPESRPVAMFSGQKMRALPAGTGVGTCSIAHRNDRVIEAARDFAQAVGYVGVCDIDFRYDQRDDAYKMLDFNPRRGAQFRLFQTVNGLDVVRMMHLGLTGRRIPSGPQRTDTRHVVGILNAKARLTGPACRCRGGCGTKTERAWFAGDDPRPAASLLLELARPARLVKAARRLRPTPNRGTR